MTDDSKNFRMVTQYIKDLSFENKLALEKKTTKSIPIPDFNLDIKNQSLGNSFYEVSLICNVDAKIDKTSVYLIELIYCGVCKVNTNSDLAIKNILYSKVPSFIYPYARLIISNLTTHSNFPSINIGPIYFEDINQDDISSD